MVQSNEFKGATLADAVRKATAAYDRTGYCERKDKRRCNDLILKITNLQRQIGNLADEIDGLQDQAEDLRTSARRTLALSALTALSSLSGALRAAAIAARAIRNRNRRQLSRQDALDLLSALGPVGAAAAALIAAADLREANQLARKADRLENAGKSLSEELIDALRDYDQNDCGRGGDITS